MVSPSFKSKGHENIRWQLQISASEEIKGYLSLSTRASITIKVIKSFYQTLKIKNNEVNLPASPLGPGPPGLPGYPSLPGLPENRRNQDLVRLLETISKRLS